MKQNKIPQKNVLGNAANALATLRDWLSVSESQVCSTEVLSEQLPKINSLLEDSMNDISTHFGHITENSSKIAEEIKYIDEALDIIKIGKNNVEIPDHLESLAAATSDAETAKQLKSLAVKIKSHEKDLHAELKKATDNLKKNNIETSQIVVGMQFQDRVSQNILITINIMKTIVEYIEREISASLPEISREERKQLLDKDFAKEILSQFRLGDLQVSFVNHLINHGYIENAEEIGFSMEAHVKKESDDDDIDLF